MTKKIVLLLLLTGFVAIASDALSQSPSSGPALSNPASTAPSTSAPSTSPTPRSAFPSADASKEPAKSATTAKDSPTSKAAPSGKDAAGTKAEAASTKTVPTSSVVAGSTAPSRTLVVERALITLINDNKVPATEAGMLMGPMPVEEGSSVDKDELVAQIDNRATLAKQKIAESEYLPVDKARSENDAEIEVAEAAIKVSAEDYQMVLDIQKKNPAAMSATEVRKNKFNLEKSHAQKKQALKEKEIAGLTANAKYAQFEAASIELDLRQIKAPFKGEVVEIMKKAGDWVTVGEPIMHIVGLDKVRVKGFVLASGTDGSLPGDVMGKKVKISVEGVGGKKNSVDGVIGFASPYIEGVGSSRQFRVWAEVDNEKTTDPATGHVAWKLQPGTVATMTIDLTPSKPAAATKSDAKSTDGKSGGKVQAFKPVTDDDKANTKKKSREF